MKKAIGAAALMMMILVFPQASVNGARNAMAVWYKSVAPTLFPFFVLMPRLTSEEVCDIYERLFGKAMNRVFRLPGSAAPAMMISMLAGSPAGAMAITRVASSGKISKTNARRMAMALCGLSPSFLILGIGQEMYGSVRFGWQLAGIQVMVQFALLFLSRGIEAGEEKYAAAIRTENIMEIKVAVESVLAVCGYMVIFGAVSSMVASIFGKQLGNLMLLGMDLPGGSAALSKLSIEGKAVLQLAAVGFGGGCIALQNMDVLKRIGVSWMHYLAGRFAAAAMFVGIGILFENAYINAAERSIAGKNVNVYAISLFFACVGVLPWIYLVRKNIFLNNRKAER